MFAALAASSLMGSSSRPPNDETLLSTQPSSSNPPAEPSASVSGPVSPTVQHRRSRRLAKQTPAISTAALAIDDGVPASHLDGEGGSPREPDFESTVPPAEVTGSETVVDSELQAEFTDEEDIDAEVFDDEIDHDHSISEKTVTLAVAEGLWNLVNHQTILIFTF